MRSFLDTVLQIFLYYSGINAFYMAVRANHLAVLGYHSVSDSSNKAELQNDIYKHLSVPISMFEAEMKILQKYGYIFLRFSDLLAIRRGERALPHRAALIYFDDGYKDNYLNAYPILKRLGIPAIIFVVTDCVDKKKILWETDINPTATNIFLSWEELRAMRDVFDIGTHTVTHQKLTMLSADEIREEFTQSRKRIQEMTGGLVTALSYPKSKFTGDSRRIAEDVGFDFVLAYGRGFRHSADFRHLEKIPVGPADSLMRFRMKLGIYYPLVSMFGK